MIASFIVFDPIFAKISALRDKYEWTIPFNANIQYNGQRIS